MSYLRDETARHGFPTSDGVHMGPCEVHRRHSHTVGPDGSLYACPGFTGEFALAVGHIDGRRDVGHAAAARRLDRLAPWRQCGDCPFIPVCGGGCSVAGGGPGDFSGAFGALGLAGLLLLLRRRDKGKAS